MAVLELNRIYEELKARTDISLEYKEGGMDALDHAISVIEELTIQDNEKQVL